MTDNAVTEITPIDGSSGAFFAQIAPQLRSQGIEALLPAGVSFEQFARAAATAMAQTPELADAEPKSVIQSLIRCATHGLIPDNREAALVTFREKGGVIKAQYIPMVDGVLKRARQSGQIAVIAAKAVFDGDAFDYWIDEQGEHISYRPTRTGRGEFSLAFAFAKLHSGELIVEVMPKEDIERVRAASKTGNSEFGPWVKWYDRMAVKSVLHRLARRLPSASELVSMLESGDEFEFNRSQHKPQQSQSRVLDMVRGQKHQPVTVNQAPPTEPQAAVVDHSEQYANWEQQLLSATTVEKWQAEYVAAWQWAESTGSEEIKKGIKQLAGEAKKNLTQQ